MTSGRRLLLALLLLLVIALSGAYGFYAVLDGALSYSECVYRTVLTIATVNEPLDLEEHPNLTDDDHRFLRHYTMVLLLVGIGVVLYAATTLAAIILETDYGGGARRRRHRKRLAMLDSHIVICGGGETGEILLQELRRLGEAFVIIESCGERVDFLREEYKDLLVIHGDATLDSVLNEAGIARARGVIVALPGDKENLFVVISARQLNPGITVIARSLEPATNSKLRHAGANFVVAANEISANRMVSAMLRPNVVTFLDHMLHGPDHETQRVEEVIVQPGSALENQTLETAQIGSRIGLLVIALQQPREDRFRCNPNADEPLRAGTALFVLGDVRKVPELRRMAGESTPRPEPGTPERTGGSVS